MEFATNNPNIVYLRWNSLEQVQAVCDLHERLLPESILSKLGNLFLSKFYYRELVKHRLIDVYLYRCQGEYAGFISCTNRPFTFMRQGLQRGFLQVLLLLTASVAMRPGRLLVLLKYLVLMKRDKLMSALAEQYGDQMGEFLSFGVLEKFRKCVDEVEDKTVSNVLMELVSKHFRANLIKYALLRILPSNTRAIRFYHKHSGYIITSPNPHEVVMLIETSASALA